MTIDDGGGGTEEDWRDGGAWTAWRAVATRRAGCFARPLAPPLEESRSVGVTARRVGEVLRAAASMARPRLALTLRAGLPGALMAFDGDEEAARREPTWCDVAVSASRLRVLSRGLGSHALTARGWRGVGALVLDWREEGSSGDRVTLTLFDA